ncbi:MAG: META domain-containing protein [Candidatus Pacebacteria bacterium]|nr:META domain-containing protein [Candidatus Paceibacterota bacterium]
MIKNILKALAILIALLVIITLVSPDTQKRKAKNTDATPIVFVNDALGASLSVIFQDNMALIQTTEGTSFPLMSISSASGARYTSEDGTLVLWNKGDSVTIFLNDEIIFEGTALGGAGLSAGSDAVTQKLTSAVWVWEKTQMNNDDLFEPLRAGAFTLTFTNDGNIYGTTDCNGFGGSYTLDGTKISTSEFFSTMMFCENSQERDFMDMVSVADQVFFDDADNLVLLLPYDSGSIIFSRQPNIQE